jgi:hypothetical protein
MSTDRRLHEKLRKIEALFAGAGTEGERLAAGAALERIRATLDAMQRSETPIELQLSVPDQWARHLLLALCRRYGIEPYRYPRQRRSTVMVRAPNRFIEQVLWPEFQELEKELRIYLQEVTLRVIREQVHSDTSDAKDAAPALPPR